jgi:ATP-dependent Clp protease ATP-binding subunit ClpA
MFERFTTPARRSVELAQDAARRLGDDHIGVEHLLLGVLAQSGTVAATTLTELGVTTERVEHELTTIRSRGTLGPAEAEALHSIGIDLDAIRRRIEASFGPGALDRGRARRRGHLPFTPTAKKTLELGLREALALKHKEIGAEHLLLGVTRAPGEPTGGVLRALEAPPDSIRALLLARMRRAS